MSKESARALAAARKKARLTTKQLADRTGVPWNYIRSLEADGIRKPDPNRLAKLANELGLELPRLLAMTDQLGAVVDVPPAVAAPVPIELIDAVRAAVREEIAALRSTAVAPIAPAPTGSNMWPAFLKAGLSVRHWKPGHLASLAGVDGPTVERWLAGVATPPIGKFRLIFGAFMEPAEPSEQAEQQRRRTA